MPESRSLVWYRSPRRSRRDVRARLAVEPLEDRTVAAALPAGSLDPTFGVGGLVTTAVGTAATVLDDLTVQPDGKIVAVGYASELGLPRSSWIVARYTTAGQLDPTFGVGGLVRFDFTLGFNRADAVLVQPDGRILVGGATGAGYAALARLNADGTFDPSFGTAGRVTGPVYALATITGIATTADRILVTGPSSSAHRPDVVVTELDPFGVSDLGFGVNGIASVSTGPFTPSEASDVAVAADGTIYVSATFDVGDGFTRAGVVAFRRDGVPLGLGLADLGVLPGERASSIVIQPTGSVLIAGTAQVADPGGGFPRVALALAQFLPDLTPDPSLAGSGRVLTAIGGEPPGATGLALQSDGKIVVAGGNGRSGFVVARYLVTGALDATFGSGGLARIAIGQASFASALGITPGTGTIVTGGGSFTPSQPVVLTLARLVPSTTTTKQGSDTPDVSTPSIRPRPLPPRRPRPFARRPPPRPRPR